MFRFDGCRERKRRSRRGSPRHSFFVHAGLVEKFPQYNGLVVAEFGRTIMDSG